MLVGQNFLCCRRALVNEGGKLLGCRQNVVAGSDESGASALGVLGERAGDLAAGGPEFLACGNECCAGNFCLVGEGRGDFLACCSDCKA